jgi:hypothetical protein
MSLDLDDVLALEEEDLDQFGELPMFDVDDPLHGLPVLELPGGKRRRRRRQNQDTHIEAYDEGPRDDFVPSSWTLWAQFEEVDDLRDDLPALTDGQMREIDALPPGGHWIGTFEKLGRIRVVRLLGPVADDGGEASAPQGR